jgi:hypothetical protein
LENLEFPPPLTPGKNRVLLIGCGMREFSLRSQKIKPVARARASNEEVSKILGIYFTLTHGASVKKNRHFL